jgi:hypothetical protein
MDMMTKEGFYIADAEELAEMHRVDPKPRRRRRDSCSEDEALDVVPSNSIAYPVVQQRQKESLTTIKHRQLQYHDDQGLSNRVGNNLKKSEQKIDDDRLRNKDKADRATLEMCLDPRTMIIIDKWTNNKRID